MRGVLGVAAVAACVAMAAGYGSPSLRAIAHNEAKYFGDPHATITRVEKVRVGRTRWAMIQMKGRRPFRLGCSPVGGDAVAVSCHPRYLVLGVKLSTHEVGLYWGLTESQVSAITTARRADRRLRIFPDTTNLYVRCAIPKGGAQIGHPTLTGTCTTITRPLNRPDNRVKQVEFIESWSPSGLARGRTQNAGWTVTLTPGGRVQSIRVTGQPPQLWK